VDKEGSNKCGEKAKRKDNAETQRTLRSAEKKGRKEGRKEGRKKERKN
jgi:hypothetical protein